MHVLPCRPFPPSSPGRIGTNKVTNPKVYKKKEIHIIIKYFDAKKKANQSRVA